MEKSQPDNLKLIAEAIIGAIVPIVMCILYFAQNRHNKNKENAKRADLMRSQRNALISEIQYLKFVLNGTLNEIGKIPETKNQRKHLNSLSKKINNQSFRDLKREIIKVSDNDSEFG